MRDLEAAEARERAGAIRCHRQIARAARHGAPHGHGSLPDRPPLGRVHDPGMDADGRQSHRGGNMLGAAIVADIQHACRQQTRQDNERCLPGHRRDGVRTQSALHKRVGYFDLVRAADQQNIYTVALDQQIDQGGEMLFGPLLGGIAGARMDGDHRLGEQRPNAGGQLV